HLSTWGGANSSAVPQLRSQAWTSSPAATLPWATDSMASSVCCQRSCCISRSDMYRLSASLMSQLLERRDSSAMASKAFSTSGRSRTVVALTVLSVESTHLLQCNTLYSCQPQLFRFQTE